MILTGPHSSLIISLPFPAYLQQPEDLGSLHRVIKGHSFEERVWRNDVLLLPGEASKGHHLWHSVVLLTEKQYYLLLLRVLKHPFFLFGEHSHFLGWLKQLPGNSWEETQRKLLGLRFPRKLQQHKGTNRQHL